MTLLPAPARLIRSVDAEPYELSRTCASPLCHDEATDGHHVARRSAGHHTFWIEIAGVQVGNVVGLCRECHLHVTGGIGGHEARILWDEEAKQYLWLIRDGDNWGAVGELDPHPPIVEHDSAPVLSESGAAEALPGALLLRGPRLGKDGRQEHGRGLDGPLSVPESL